MRAGISVEYLTRIEQGRDRNPSASVVNALADGLSLDAYERSHLHYLVKITNGACGARERPRPPRREVRPAVLETLDLLEPGVALVTNRLGDVLAYTRTFELVMRETGLLEDGQPNLTRYLFTDPRAKDVFVDWDQVADEQVFQLWLGPSAASFEWFKAELAPVAGAEFTRRLDNHLPPAQIQLRLNHPDGHHLVWHRERLELSGPEAQQLVIFLPADDFTTDALTHLRRRSGRTLRAV